MKRISPYALGATLYMPATRNDIADVAMGRKIAGLRSLVICLEDAVDAANLDHALAQLRSALMNINGMTGRREKGPLLFVRPRDADMAALLSDWEEIDGVDGFVIPKLAISNIRRWRSAARSRSLMLMPTLETRELFDPGEVTELGDALRSEFGERTLALRIGGNDLMACLGLRRNATTTLYQTPMGYVIPMLTSILGAQGFAMTAPVFEQLSSPEIFREEIALDVAHGLVGKTAIHPSQIAPIHHALQVSLDDFNAAQLILDEAAPAVFRHLDAMCEPATHHAWAKRLVERARWHGVRSSNISPSIGA